MLIGIKDLFTGLLPNSQYGDAASALLSDINPIPSGGYQFKLLKSSPGLSDNMILLLHI